MKISIIAAIGKNNEIGLNNQLLWKSKSDLGHFKQLTLGKPLIMGRKTFESLPGILPGRTHIVISHYTRRQPMDQVLWDYSLESAIDYCKQVGHTDVFIIGGASIYEQALPLADELHISHMDWTGEADTLFPEIGTEWSRHVQTTVQRGTTGEPDWYYTKYTRK